MASVTIRNLDAELKARLRVRAAQHGRSMEEELRAIVRAAVAVDDEPASGLATALRRRFRSLGGVELDIPPRERMRTPPKPR